MSQNTNHVAKAASARRTMNAPGFRCLADNNLPSRYAQMLESIDLTHPQMERCLRARHVWEFLDESRSTFYARMNVDDPSYDPLFPHSIRSSTTGKGPKRWKLGAVIAWLRLCDVASNNPALFKRLVASMERKADVNTCPHCGQVIIDLIAGLAEVHIPMDAVALVESKTEDT